MQYFVDTLTGKISCTVDKNAATNVETSDATKSYLDSAKVTHTKLNVVCLLFPNKIYVHRVVV